MTAVDLLHIGGANRWHSLTVAWNPVTVARVRISPAPGWAGNTITVCVVIHSSALYRVRRARHNKRASCIGGSIANLCTFSAQTVLSCNAVDLPVVCPGAPLACFEVEVSLRQAALIPPVNCPPRRRVGHNRPTSVPNHTRPDWLALVIALGGLISSPGCRSNDVDAVEQAWDRPQREGRLHGRRKPCGRLGGP